MRCTSTSTAPLYFAWHRRRMDVHGDCVLEGSRADAGDGTSTHIHVKNRRVTSGLYAKSSLYKHVRTSLPSLSHSLTSLLPPFLSMFIYIYILRFESLTSNKQRRGRLSCRLVGWRVRGLCFECDLGTSALIFVSCFFGFVYGRGWTLGWGVGRNCLMTYGCMVWESYVEIGLWIAWGLVAGLLGGLAGGGYGGLQTTHIDTRRVCRDFFDNVYGMVVFYVDIAPSFSSLASSNRLSILRSSLRTALQDTYPDAWTEREHLLN